MTLDELSFVEYSNQLNQALHSTKLTDKLGEKLEFDKILNRLIEELSDKIRSRNSIYVIGNGGSTAIASHFCNDLVNLHSAAAYNLSDAATLTCQSNDYGYENAYARILKSFLKENDTVFLISSSGMSQNIIRAANVAKNNLLITLTGFSNSNDLISEGDYNFFIDSKSYGFVEMSHQIILHYIAERIAIA